MVSPQILRRYPFFAGLNNGQITSMAEAAVQESVADDHCFFRTGDWLDKLYFVLDGSVDIVISVPAQNGNHGSAGFILGDYLAEDIPVSSVGPGEIFSWSAVIPPHISTAGAIASTPCRVLSFESGELFELFKRDGDLGYLMIERVASVIRQRLRDMHIQSLAFSPA